MARQALKSNPPGLVDQTATACRERIVNGVYGQDGMLPPQTELCEELGVSRGVIREAMQRLQTQRLVESGQGRKPRVVPAGADFLTDSLRLVVDRTDASWSHLTEVRRTLEVDIAGLAAVRATPEDCREMEKTIGVMIAADDIRAQVSADMSFHRLLAEATGNPIYAFLLDALAALLRASRERSIGKVGVEPAIRGHRNILEAVRRRDADAARKAMEVHLEESRRHLCDEMS